MSVSAVVASAADAPPRKFTLVGDDGWFDLGAFLDMRLSAIPVAMPITEPAVGYGVAGGLIHIERNAPDSTGRPVNPDLAAIAGFATENGSGGALAGYSAWWLDGRLQTLVGAGYISLNLEFFGIGDDRFLRDNPVEYNAKGGVGALGANVRIGRSPVMVGLMYGIASIDVSAEHGQRPRGIRDKDLETRIAGLMPSVTYDTRNNLFTPTDGLYVNVGAGLSSESLGGTVDFQRVMVTVIDFWSPHHALTFGARGDLGFSFGSVPFYLRPAIMLRGVQVLSYQGDEIAQVELEGRWQFWKRFSVVGFVGGGLAWTEHARFENRTGVVSGGGGFRYEISKRHGLHMGLDVGFGPRDPILYLVFGSSWFRP
jgi:hypothetical protein